MDKPPIRKGTVQAILRDDWPKDEAAYGLEKWDGTTWVSLYPEHPTFATKRDADYYASLKFGVWYRR